MDRPELIISPGAPLAFVDIETTGGTAGVHRIIDVAVVGMTGGRVDFEWQSLVNPGVSVPGGISALTGIDNDMLVGAPRFEDIARELRERLAGRVFVAHNVRFDYGFIRREFARLETQWRSPSMCTVRLSRALYPEMSRHNLDAVMEHHGIVMDNRHRAMPDAQVLRLFWSKLHTAWSEPELQAAMDRASLRATLPAALPPELAEDLPEAPGVYRFYGASGPGETLLYVGKANNLRERVLDHFRERANAAKARELAAQVSRVDWTQTPGELGALLLEAREIRELQPAYNRALRGGADRLTWLFAGTAAPELVQLDAGVLRSGNAFGTYRSERDARRALESLAREHKWCFKLLGLEGGEGSCVGFQIGRCNGACTGKESAALHLTRIKIGLMPLLLKHWPYAGPMMVPEGRGEHLRYHVVDGWQHLGTVEPAEDGSVEELQRLGARARPAAFDIDSYRILTRLLREPQYRPVPLPRS